MTPPARSFPPFRSFWMAGYEGADHRNGAGRQLEMQKATGHDARVEEDYRAAAALGLRVARESLSWRTVEGPQGFEFGPAIARAKAAQRCGIQLCWSLCRYGWPDDVDVFSPHGRYGRPLVISETSRFGGGRGTWVREVATEVADAMRAGVPVLGICLYPAIDRPDWDDDAHWHNSGLWDGDAGEPALPRTLNEPYAQALRATQAFLEPLLPAA